MTENVCKKECAIEESAENEKVMDLDGAGAFNPDLHLGPHRPKSSVPKILVFTWSILIFWIISYLIFYAWPDFKTWIAQ